VANITGTDGNDVLTGTGDSDSIFGLDGNDELWGGDGNDHLNGGLGDDLMAGEGGDDYLDSTAGGSDTMIGGEGNDRFQIYRTDLAASVLSVDGGNGDDQLYYEALVSTGGGPLNYAVNGDTMTVTAGAGNDRLQLGAIAQATIDAGAGRDHVIVDIRSPALNIALGADADILQLNWNYFQWNGGTREVSDFQVGAGGDLLVFTRLNNGHAYAFTAGNPFAEGYLRLVQQGADTLVQLDVDGAGTFYTYHTAVILRGVQASSLTQENLGFPVTGSAAATTQTGTAAGEVIYGQGGADTIDAMGGNDTLYGSNGDDTLNGGEGRDTLWDGFGNDVLNGGADDDWLYANDGGNDALYGGDGRDYISASRTQFSTPGTVLLDGGAGGDWIYYFQIYHLFDTVTIVGGEGDDYIQAFPAVSVSIDAGVGNDVVFADVMGGPVTVSLGGGTDVLTLTSSFFAQQVNPSLVTVSDFDAGNVLELLDINRVFSGNLPNLYGYGQDATRSGHFRAVQDGADTVFEIDRNGGADSWLPFLRLSGVNAASLTPDRLQFSNPYIYLLPGITGSSGADIYIGTQNDNAYYGGAGNDTIYGEGGQDTLSGEAGDDLIVGGAGNDVLFGGAGADQLYGGADGDIYWVDSQSDLVFELDAVLGDAVFSTASYYLYANVEELFLALGSAAQFGVGNELDNLIGGNELDNLLIGGAGADSIDGWLGSDTLYGQDGADFVTGSDGNDYLAGGIGDDELRGDDGADAVYGEAGDDYLVGGYSFDTDILVGGDGTDVLDGAGGLGDYDLLNGGAGDDFYRVDTPADLTFEAAGEGIDTVVANIVGAGYYLYPHVENLFLEGETPFGVGNDLDNELLGSPDDNWLLGGAGSDTLNGSLGNDVLFGEAGADIFVFRGFSGQDLIGDFAAGIDKLDLSTLFASFLEVQVNFVQNGADGAINLGEGNLVVLQGVDMSALTATDFIFG
jgi:Ca2+-binding RTX toxin-like protein